jgi:putative PIN family toxin of toxin-antitoxin system
VLDTNVLVSALFWDGNERELLRLCRNKELHLILSFEILDELTRVLIEKFGLPEDKVNEYREEILLMSELVLLKGDLKIIEDDLADNVILETAILGEASTIFTGDKHLLKLEKYKNIKIKKSSNQ